jgi:hypothetical protein
MREERVQPFAVLAIGYLARGGSWILGEGDHNKNEGRKMYKLTGSCHGIVATL